MKAAREICDLDPNQKDIPPELMTVSKSELLNYTIVQRLTPWKNLGLACHRPEGVILYVCTYLYLLMGLQEVHIQI